MKYLINNITTNWKAFIQKQFSEPYMQKIDSILFNSNDLVLPRKELIFRAFNYSNIEDTRIVIFGQDPYHGLNQADGLAFSVCNQITPPSLKNIFKLLEKETGNVRTNPNLEDWAKQKILLLNTSLTVIAHQANSHKHIGWINFIYATIDLLNHNEQPILFVLLGNNAKALAKKINQQKHQILMAPHPSPLSAYKNFFFDCKLFSTINSFYLEKYNTKIKW